MFEDQLINHLPLNRREIFASLNKGCSNDILKYLTSYFWVKDETDSNEDLGFVFNLRVNEFANSFYRLYLSCVIPCATLRLYQVDDNGNDFSVSVAVSKDESEQERLLINLVSFLESLEFRFLFNDDLSRAVSSSLLFKIGPESRPSSYFDLLFQANA